MGFDPAPFGSLSSVLTTKPCIYSGVEIIIHLLPLMLLVCNNVHICILVLTKY